MGSGSSKNSISAQRGYKLYYFHVKGRLHSLRLLLNDNKIPYEEIDYTFEEWADIKPTTTFKKLPKLTDGEFELYESNAIIRYVARKHGLYGSNAIETTRIDEVFEAEEWARSQFINLLFSPKFEEEKSNYIKKDVPERLENFELFLKRNKDGKEFLVGNKISMADYAMADFLDAHLVLSSKVLDDFPVLKEFHSRIMSRPNLSTYRDSDDHKTRIVGGALKF